MDEKFLNDLIISIVVGAVCGIFTYLVMDD
jgi:F0F1-type ATP synthase assembly protein I